MHVIWLPGKQYGMLLAIVPTFEMENCHIQQAHWVTHENQETQQVLEMSNGSRGVVM